MRINKAVVGIATLVVVAAVVGIATKECEQISRPHTGNEVAEEIVVSPTKDSSETDPEHPGIPNENSVQEVADGLTDGDVIELGESLVGKRILIENCRAATVPVLSDGAITYFTSQECERNIRYDEPYDSMSRQDLEILAETDAAAALVLGDKLAAELGAGEEIVMRLYIHALALSAHPDSFEALYNYINGGHATVYADGQLNVDTAARAYVWSSVGSRLGFTSDELVNTYRDALDRSGQDLDKLNLDIEHWTTAITERRHAVETGSR